MQVKDIKVRLKKAEQSIDAMTLRERGLIMLTGIALIAAVWFLFLVEPLNQKADARTGQLQELQERVDEVNRNLQQQVLEIAGGSAEQRARVASVNLQIESINEQLGDYAAELIDPSEMASVLEGVLADQKSLHLVRIRNLPSETLAASEEENATRFYRHGLEIEVEGSYHACLEYLAEIEDLPWRLYWQILDLEVIDYPTNRIRIEVSTLSLDEEWIGA